MSLTKMMTSLIHMYVVGADRNMFVYVQILIDVNDLRLVAF